MYHYHFKNKTNYIEQTNKVEFSLRLLFFILTIFVSSQLYLMSAEGQEDKSTNMIYAQTIVRDSEGRLVTYLETTRIHVVDSRFIEKTINDNRTIIINSESTEADDKLGKIVTFQPKPLSYDTEGTRGVTFLGEVVSDRIFIKLGAWFLNDGYFLEPDDKLTVIWTAIRNLE